MHFEITKHHIRGSLKGTNTTEEMQFSSLEAAERWGESTSLNRLTTYLVIDIIQISKYSNWEGYSNRAREQS